MSLFALLPAAGHSTRMGRPKLSLPLGDSTVIEQVIATLKAAGIDHILTVIGPHVSELVPLSTRAGAHSLVLKEPTSDMRTTIELGLKWIEANWQPTANNAFLLVPADHPVLDQAVIRTLLKRESSATIRIPTFNGKRGHPTFIGWNHVAGIRALPRDVGLNAYLRTHPDAVCEMPVASETILFDMDTPDDYERIVAAKRSQSGV